MTETIADDVGLLRRFELRLLRCSLSPPPTPPPPPPPPPSNPLHRLIDGVLSSIERGNYSAALSSEASHHVFGFASAFAFDDTVECAERFYREAEGSAATFLVGGFESSWLSVIDPESADGDRAARAVLLMCLCVAALLAFTQRNITGPVERFPSFPLLIAGTTDAKQESGTGLWDAWARSHLASSGADVLGKFSCLTDIVYAKMLLMKTKDVCAHGISCHLPGSLSWWLSRVIFLQQRILDERSSSLYDLLQVYIGESLKHSGNLEKVISYWGSELYEGEASNIVCIINLEAGIIENEYGRVDSSRLYFNQAEEACGLQLSVTGVLGLRTVHQVDAKAQMVLVNNQDQQKNSSGSLVRCSELEKDDFVTQGADKASESRVGVEDCDILMAPKLIADGTAGNSEHSLQDGSFSSLSLGSVQQAVVLVQCLYIKKSKRDEELSRWEMAPYIEAIDAQQHCCFMVQGVYEASPVAAQRIQFSYGVYFPTIPALRKEYGELLVGCGLIGEALKTFEDLELWDNLIHCYSLLGKKSMAFDLIKARLSDSPNDPRLWCSLGDVTNNDEYYEKALEVSKNRSARAKRALARNAYNRGDYITSKVLWESAMALNSLYPDGWFALGSAALKARDIDKALDGFTPNDRRNSWQLWENYSHVAMDIGNLRQALEATKMVMDLTSSKRIDADLLDRVMVKVEEKCLRPPNYTSLKTVEDHNPSVQSLPATVLSNESRDVSGDTENDMESSRETELLVDILGGIFQQIIRSGGDVWGLYARWHKIKGDFSMCSEALLKQVRSYQGSDVWKDQDRFKKFALASLQLCNVYMEIAASTGSHRELTAAEMHLRNTIKQAVNFSNTQEFRDLQECFEEVKKRLQAVSTVNV
ncbi:hypothetical protein QJS10_CPA01g00478 [Acorus calamus]|uniref:Uncharacterized protein n=1 Tax=Acorus calamus TaxID=4465 RepID=A0AAV9FHC0_ACOCL|nr:hypothetical protein QJS10_CPA01g00478 [Acorus calamus]